MADTHTLQEIIEKTIQTTLLKAHPVGSIYMSTESTSPTDLFGGTWEQITDTFLWCASGGINLDRAASEG